MTINNIAEIFQETALKFRYCPAISKEINGKLSTITFAELNSLCNSFACEFRKNGLIKGHKILIMLTPGFEFIATVFAAMKIGAVPVLIDSGMGIKNLLNCIKKTAPQAMAGIPKILWITLFFQDVFKTIEKKFSVGNLAPPGCIKLRPVSICPNSETERTYKEDLAAIVFTSGSTGPPKGVAYTHGIFMSQLEIIREEYGAGHEEKDMPAFPLFALFSAALGMPCVIPSFNPSLPAKADPAYIVNFINRNRITFSFASPTLWRNVAEYCLEKSIKMPSLRKVLMAGAPVPAIIHEKLLKVISPEGKTIVPYGATEALPVANFSGTEVLASTASKTAEGKGYCVGFPVKYITIKIIKCVDSQIADWASIEEVPVGETGEIVVSGPVVTREYFNEPEHTKNAKIKDDNIIWHRMGDIGYFDEEGRLWFLGRKSHRVHTAEGILYPVCLEAVFNNHPRVSRSALVGVGQNGKQTPVLIIEPLKNSMPRSNKDRETFINELKKIGSENPLTVRISQFLFHRSFPVDIRHNAKISREKLAEWANRILSEN